MTNFTIHVGDCLETLKTLPDCSVDSVITDPPYGLSQHKPQQVTDCLTAWLKGEEYKPNGSGFMGKSWDAWVPSPAVWRECLRVLKPGGHLLAFAGTRSMDLMSMSVRLAGFELRDSIGYAHDGGGAPLLAWCYGSGFPKSLDVSKAIGKAAGAEREVVGFKSCADGGTHVEAWPGGENGNDGWQRPGRPTGDERGQRMNTAPATDAARQWQGWGTALKPAWEPIILARKPLDGTVAENVLAHGTGAINVDGCRIEYGERPLIERAHQYRPESFDLPSGSRNAGVTTQGRWPANVVHDGSDKVLAGFPGGAKAKSARSGQRGGSNAMHMSREAGSNDFQSADGYWPADPGGSAARFFYCAKASKRDRDEGLEGFDKHVINVTEGHGRGVVNTSKSGDGIRENRPRANTHPTVKPTNLMRYLCRLVTPPNGVVLDPFTGSGSTGKAAVLEGFNFIGCELQEDYAAIAKARISSAVDKSEKQFSLAE